MTKLDKKRLPWLISGLIRTLIVGALLFFSANATNNNSTNTATTDNNDGSHWRHWKPPLCNKTHSDGKLLRSPEMNVSTNWGSPSGNLTRLPCGPELNVTGRNGSSQMWNLMTTQGDKQGEARKHPAKMTPYINKGGQINDWKQLAANLTRGDVRKTVQTRMMCAGTQGRR